MLAPRPCWIVPRTRYRRCFHRSHTPEHTIQSNPIINHQSNPNINPIINPIQSSIQSSIRSNHQSIINPIIQSSIRECATNGWKCGHSFSTYDERADLRSTIALASASARSNEVAAVLHDRERHQRARTHSLHHIVRR